MVTSNWGYSDNGAGWGQPGVTMIERALWINIRVSRGVAWSGAHVHLPAVIKVPRLTTLSSVITR
jgi:hypothetical protein